MAKLTRVKVVFDPPIRLDDDGYASIGMQVSESMADHEGQYVAKNLIMEVELVDDAPVPGPLAADEEEPINESAD